MITRIPHSPLFRRRPPRLSLLVSTLLWWGVAVSLFSSAARAQSNTVTTISTPTTTTLSLANADSVLLYLPANSSTATLPLSISLSLCSVPSSLLDTLSTTAIVFPSQLNTTLYVSNSSSLQTPGPGDASTPDADHGQGGTSALSYGWANVTLSSWTDGAWIAVYAPDANQLLDGDDAYDSSSSAAPAVTGNWTFELDVRPTLEPDWVAQGAVGLRFEDSDATGVLLSSANFTAANETSSPSAPAWTPLVAEASVLSTPLARSRCFVRQAAVEAAAARERSTANGTTTRGYGGGVRSQFEVRGLDGGRNYTAWLVLNETAQAGATTVWDPVFFTTKSSDSCRLLYNLDFCPNVAYAVPSPPALSTDDLVSYFNSSLQPSLAAFARTLTTFPCDVPSMGQYSVVSTCADCNAAYRDWACATAIPRCTDAPSNATLNDTTAAGPQSPSGLASWFLPEEAQTTLVRSDPFASRTPAFGPANLSSTFPSLFNASFPASASNLAAESPFPYSEVPPCTDVCSLVQARCPPFLEWSCPRMSTTDGQTGLAGYGLTRQIEESERMVGDFEGGKRDERAQDKWGNVFCNALGTDLVSAAQFLPLGELSTSLAAVSNAAPAFAALALLAITVVTLAV
ncbi:hypothetical protein JCM10207_001653 [Rhodosporidiobolus poonsookiae]